MTTYQVLDDDDEYDWGDDDEWDDNETACVDCGAPGIDCCQCCGGYLCGMHGEIGCGFCRKCPTQEWIDEQNGVPVQRPPVRKQKREDDDDELPF